MILPVFDFRIFFGLFVLDWVTSFPPSPIANVLFVVYFLIVLTICAFWVGEHLQHTTVDAFITDSKNIFSQKNPKQRRSKQQKQRSWKQKRSKYSQKLRKYRKRRRNLRRSNNCRASLAKFHNKRNRKHLGKNKFQQFQRRFAFNNFAKYTIHI